MNLLEVKKNTHTLKLDLAGDSDLIILWEMKQIMAIEQLIVSICFKIKLVIAIRISRLLLLV